LEDLQMDFRILPVGVAEAGSWRYAFIYDIAARHFKSLPQQARPISEAQARRRLLQLYFNSLGAAQRRDVIHLFGWTPELADRAIARLAAEAFITTASHPTQPGDWLALPSLCR
jgi:hypothetical protein